MLIIINRISSNNNLESKLAEHALSRKRGQHFEFFGGIIHQCIFWILPVKFFAKNITLRSIMSQTDIDWVKVLVVLSNIEQKIAFNLGEIGCDDSTMPLRD